MASSSVFLASPIPSKPAQRRPSSLPSTTSVPSSISAVPRSLRRPPPKSRLLTAAAAAVQVEQQDSVKPVAQPSSPPPALPFRVGHGFDLHRLEPGLPLIIGGINIPHDRGCEAHSDGDVLLHCVVDAILGALGLPDIGQIFPDSDPKWKGAASSVFVREAIGEEGVLSIIILCVLKGKLCKFLSELSEVEYKKVHVRSSTGKLVITEAVNRLVQQVRLMHEAGYELGNLDATLILQKPKLSPHKEAIRTNLCDLLGANPSVVNLKAKTHEKVDSLGENRSIAAHTVVLLMRK